MRAFVTWFLSRYTRASFLAWGVLAVTYVTVAVLFSHLIDVSRGMDWLLAGIWAFMTLVLAWDVDLRRDGKLAAVAFLGGLVIEWWGTTTELWRYYTDERPPLWILPAWPVSALAIDRIARVLDRLPPFPRTTWLALPLFVAAMLQFSAPAWAIPSSKVIAALMIGVLLTVREPRRDVLIFVGGSALGIFLEYWGTSRWCWRYYTGEEPPVIAAFAHGFASVAFARGLALAEAVGRRLPLLQPSP